MKRREFFKNAAAVSVAGGLSISSAQNLFAGSFQTKNSFKLRYAPHFGMFRESAGNDLVDQLQFMADQGFTALEDNGMMDRSVEDQERIAKKMSSLGMTMGVFVAHKIYWSEPNLAGGNKEKRDEFLDYIKKSVEVAKRVNAKWMTVVPGHLDLRLEMDYQNANVMEALRRACDIIEPHGLVMVLEPLNRFNHPGLFLTKIPQANLICKAVDSPSCKILFDIYHQQIQEGNLIPNMDMAWDEIAYFQVGDNPGRKEPGTGEINYRNVFKHIHDKGFSGVVGMEHGNSIKSKEGELKVIEAYKMADDF
jgi:hydroxypyruvate isomerase